MHVVEYTGSPWNGEAVQADFWRLLMQKDRLIQICGGRQPIQVVLGVPHHAGPGVDRIADDWLNPKTGRPGRPADETTGMIGLAVFQALQELHITCKLVIAAHPTDHDPNKTPGSPYWQAIFLSEETPDRSGGGRLWPEMLIELHGAAKHRKYGIELSAGNNTAADPLRFGSTMARLLEEDWSVAIQREAGTSDALICEDGGQRTGRLQNPALETLSLSYAGQIGIPALHLEMKSIFRQPDPAFPGSPRPAPQAWQLARALAKTIQFFCRPSAASTNS